MICPRCARRSVFFWAVGQARRSRLQRDGSLRGRRRIGGIGGLACRLNPSLLLIRLLSPRRLMSRLFAGLLMTSTLESHRHDDERPRGWLRPQYSAAEIRCRCPKGVPDLWGLGDPKGLRPVPATAELCPAHLFHSSLASLRAFRERHRVQLEAPPALLQQFGVRAGAGLGRGSRRRQPACDVVQSKAMG